MTSIATDDEEHGSAVATVRERIRTGFDASRVGRTAARVRERLRGSAAAVGTAASRSAVADVGSSLRRGYETSRLAAGGATLSTWVRNSWAYGWLTAEPDPDVIVIDLRETRTIGPIIEVLDRVVPKAASAAHESTVWAVSERVYGAAARPLSGSRVIRWCAAALEPPEPPTETSGESADGGDGDPADGGDGNPADRRDGNPADDVGSGSSADEDGVTPGEPREEPPDGGDTTRNE